MRFNFFQCHPFGLGRKTRGGHETDHRAAGKGEEQLTMARGETTMEVLA